MNVGFFGLDPPCPLENLPEQIQPAIYRYTDVGRDEVVAIEFLRLARKCVEATEQDNYRKETEAEPGGVRLEARFEDERVASDTLSAESAMELDVCDRDGHPGQDGGDGGKVLEPLKDGLGAGGARHEGQQRDGGGKADAIVWDAS